VCPDCLRAPQPLETEFFCARCRAPFVNAFPLDERGLCALCRGGMRGFDAAFSYGPYDGPLRELVQLFKYGGVKTLAQPLGEFLAVAFPRDERIDALVPVPLHWLRQRRRGFNQSESLAREIARRTNTPVWRALKRERQTAAQAGLSNAARRRNVAGAFRCARRFAGGAELKGKRILLIDDVMTTGSTAAACASALKRAGAARVTLLTVARVDRRFSAAAKGSN
jgi:ComF family protein